MKTQHTPTPWQIDDNENLEIRALDSLTICRFDMSDYNEKCTEANAAHIVKCVNLHDELVKALNLLVADSHVRKYIGGINTRDFEDLLKRAKGGGNGNG